MIFRKKIFCHGIAFLRKKAGSRQHGLSNMAALAGPQRNVSSGPKNSLQQIASAPCHLAYRWSDLLSTPSARRNKKPASCPASCPATIGGAKGIQNLAQVLTWLRCVQRPSAMATIML